MTYRSRMHKCDCIQLLRLFNHRVGRSDKKKRERERGRERESDQSISPNGGRLGDASARKQCTEDHPVPWLDCISLAPFLPLHWSCVHFLVGMRVQNRFPLPCLLILLGVCKQVRENKKEKLWENGPTIFFFLLTKKKPKKKKPNKKKPRKKKKKVQILLFPFRLCFITIILEKKKKDNVPRSRTT